MTMNMETKTEKAQKEGGPDIKCPASMKKKSLCKKSICFIY